MPDRFFDDKVTFMIWYVLCCKPEHTVRNAAFDNVIPRFFDSNTVPTRQNCLITALRAADQAVHPAGNYVFGGNVAPESAQSSQ